MKHLLASLLLLALLLGLALPQTGCGAVPPASFVGDGGDGETHSPPPKTHNPSPTEKPHSPPPATQPQEDPVCAEKTAKLPDDFIMGVDLSSLIAQEASGVRYYDFDGTQQDIMKTLAENGVTHIRVRIWVDPYDENGNGYGGGNNDAKTAAEIAKRAAQYGLALIADFHYSDFWADPGKQMAPKAWADMDLAEKADAAYAFTKDTLAEIQNVGGVVGMVQVGNETNGALCGETDWDGVCAILSAGSRAVRDICPDALVAVHFANPEKTGAYDFYAKELDSHGVDYDVFGSSYYPLWHGTLDNLTNVLSKVAQTYDKKTMVLETSYPYTAQDTDFNSNTISDTTTGITKNYPFTVQGQADALCDVIDAVTKTTNGIGVCYWEAAWITVGGSSHAENEALWERFGSGWASRFAAEYDPNDAGKYYGGCAVDNQALFGPDGVPLDSLKVFRMRQNGGAGESAP